MLNILALVSGNSLDRCTFCYKIPSLRSFSKSERLSSTLCTCLWSKKIKPWHVQYHLGRDFFARKALVLIEHPSLDTHHQRMHWNQHFLVLSFFTLLNLALKNKLNCVREYIDMLITSSVPICPY